MTFLMIYSCGNNEPGRIAKFAVHFEQLVSIVNIYNIECGKYPTVLNDLKTTLDCDTWNNTDIEIVDVWGREYGYRYPPDLNKVGINFELFSRGEDGIEGTEDDLANWIDSSVWMMVYRKNFKTK